MSATASPARATGRYRDALANRDYRLLMGSFAVDQLGTWASNVVLLVYVYERTGSAGALAVASAARYVPMLLVSGYAGVLADRYDRARFMRASALTSGFLATAMTAVVAVDGPVPLLLVLAGLLAASVSAYYPASGALTADAVDERDLAAANSLHHLVDNLGVVLGPLVGAAVLAAGTPLVGFAVNAASFFVAAALVAGVRTRSRGDAGAAGESTWQQVVDGGRALTSDTVALLLVGFMLLGSAAYGTTNVLYVTFSEEAGGGSGGYGWLLAGQAVGGVAVAALTNRLAGRPRLTGVIVTGLVVMAVPLAGLGLAGSLAVGAALQFLFGAGMVVIDVLAITALQRGLPRERLSRVLGLVDAAAIAAILLGSVAAAALVGGLGLDAAVVVLGLVLAGAALLGARPLARAEGRAAEVAAGLVDRVAVLERLDLFADAGRPALERLALGLSVVEADPGLVVVAQGDAADALWVVVTGRLDVDVDGVATNVVEEGEYAGEIGLLHGRPRSATVTAGVPSVLWRIPGEDFVDALTAAGPSASLRGLAESRLGRRPVAAAAAPGWAAPR